MKTSRSRTIWRPRFTLRMLFCVVLLAGAALGLYVNRAIRHRDSVANIRTWQGLGVLYDYQVDWNTGRVSLLAQPSTNDSLTVRLFGEDAALEIVQAAFDDPALVDHNLTNLLEHRGIRILSLKCPNITDEGLRYISRLSELRELGLMNNDHISDDGILCLARLKKLEKLSLNRLDKVTDAGRQKLQAALPHCTILYSYAGEVSSSRTVSKPTTGK